MCARVLLIDDDPITLETVGLILRTAGYNVAHALTAQDALSAAATTPPDVALVDLRLPDASGLEVLRALQRDRPSTACILVTGFATTRDTVEAMRLGAFDVVEKPIVGDEVIELVDRAVSGLTNHQREVTLNPVSHAMARWANVVVQAIDAPADPRTLHDWGRAVGASVGAIRNWCRTAGLSSRRSLLFARMLRAVAIRQKLHVAAPEDLLDVVDRRTLAKLLRACSGTSDRLPSSVAEFLDRQTFITESRAIVAIRAALDPTDVTARSLVDNDARGRLPPPV